MSSKEIIAIISNSTNLVTLVEETNSVATEKHDLDFSFCLMTSLSMFQQLFFSGWLMQHQEKEATSSNILLKIHKGGKIVRKVHFLYSLRILYNTIIFWIYNWKLIAFSICVATYLSKKGYWRWKNPAIHKQD